MTQRQIIMQQYFGIAPDSEVCGNCEHFVQHYNANLFWSRNVERVTPMHCGHCTYPRLKNRTVHDSCDKFAPAYKYEGVGELSDDEREFLDMYRRQPEAAQRAVVRLLAASAAERESRTATVRKIRMAEYAAAFRAKVQETRRGEIIEMPKVKEE